MIKIFDNVSDNLGRTIATKQESSFDGNLPCKKASELILKDLKINKNSVGLTLVEHMGTLPLKHTTKKVKDLFKNGVEYDFRIESAIPILTKTNFER